ncbi:MAG: nuclear transport factor 2 family protein [Bacteroidota bacterium]
MKKINVSLLLVFFVSFTLFSQTNEKGKVMKVINEVFDAMRTNDSTLLKACFIASPHMFTLYEKEDGSSSLSKGDFQKFASTVGQSKAQVWDERIWNEKVEIDGNLASVWVDYAFFIEDQLSHCGVDAIHLVKDEGYWKIFHLADTRRKDPCEIPENIRP